MCDKKFVDASGTWGMFFYTSTTCTGDEIGWDFIHTVKTSKISFTGFCNEITRVYKTNTHKWRSIHVSENFHRLVFGWLSAFKIDFRKEIDPYCGHNPKMLACDGTHIGVSLQHLQLEKPVTKADINDQVPWLHGHVTHCLFQNEEIHTHVKYMALKALNKLNEETLTPLEANERSIQLLEQVSMNLHWRLSSAIFLPICWQRNHRSSSTGTFPVIRGVSDRVGFTTKSIRFNWHNLWQSGEKWRMWKRFAANEEI